MLDNFSSTLKRSQFTIGWMLVLISSFLPIFFSLLIDASASLDIKSIDLIILKNVDPTHLVYYLVFVTIHMFICFGITYLTHDIYRCSTTDYLYMNFFYHNGCSFILVSLGLILVVLISNSSLEVLSGHLIKMATDTYNKALFKIINVSIAEEISYDLVIFFCIPLAAIISAFAPASAIMLSIPHFTKKIGLYNRKDLYDELPRLRKRLDFIYIMMLVLFVSSTIATFLYLRVPRSFISDKSLMYIKYCDLAFGVWCLIFFLILLITSAVTYISFTNAIRKTNQNYQIIDDRTYEDNIDLLISSHSFLKSNLLILFGPFTPVLALLASKTIS